MSSIAPTMAPVLSVDHVVDTEGKSTLFFRTAFPDEWDRDQVLDFLEGAVEGIKSQGAVIQAAYLDHKELDIHQWWMEGKQR